MASPSFRRLEGTILAAYAALLAYVSFVPFDLTWSPPPTHGQRWILGLRAAPISLRDIVSNIVFYIPIGAMSFHMLRQKGRSRAFSAFLSATGTLAFSLAIEHLQRWFPSRVSSWVDVCSNLIGAATGIGIWWFGEDSFHRIGGRIREAAGRRWWWVCAHAFAALVLAVQLRPYDPVVDPHHAASAALRHADLHPWAPWNELPELAKAHHRWDEEARAAELARSRWEYGLDRLVDIALYAGVSLLVVAGLQRRGRGPIQIHLAAGAVTVGLATIITGIRIFLISYGLDTAHWLCGIIGWPIGCCVGNLWSASQSTNPTARIEPPSLARQRALALCCMSFVVLYEIVPFDFKEMDLFDIAQAPDICLIPFAEHVRSRLNEALYDLSGDFLRYAVFGCCLSVLLRRNDEKDWRTHLRTCVFASIVTCTALEAIHLWMPSRFTDVTTIIMAAIGSFTGVVCLKWVRDLHSTLMTAVVEDPLTSQLIDGKTYQPLSVTPGNRPHAGTSLRGPARFDPPG